jgi:hypothetical protein
MVVVQWCACEPDSYTHKSKRRGRGPQSHLNSLHPLLTFATSSFAVYQAAEGGGGDEVAASVAPDDQSASLAAEHNDEGGGGGSELVEGDVDGELPAGDGHPNSSTVVSTEGVSGGATSAASKDSEQQHQQPAAEETVTSAASDDGELQQQQPATGEPDAGDGVAADDHAMAMPYEGQYDEQAPDGVIDPFVNAGYDDAPPAVVAPAADIEQTEEATESTAVAPDGVKADEEGAAAVSSPPSSQPARPPPRECAVTSA